MARQKIGLGLHAAILANLL